MNATLDELRHVVQTCPIIDNHAHNLLRSAGLRDHDLLTSTTEADGSALEDTISSLAHLRATRQLCDLYDLPPDSIWAEILAKRQELLQSDENGLIRKCLAGIQTILIDDGLGDDKTLRGYEWHGGFTASPCKRIVRIESTATELLASMTREGKLSYSDTPNEDGDRWSEFTSAYKNTIMAALQDAEVVGFKSVVCYRSGLDVATGNEAVMSQLAIEGFRASYLLLWEDERKNYRLDQKSICDALVNITCRCIESHHVKTGIAKPFQFHTGLGDRDISLLTSNPACLQPLIKAYPDVPIVLLHSSYPYTREAGYLATVYKNVFLDIGEVFPQVSRDGQESLVRHAFELTPTSKILWSTDGHFIPETYWLACIQSRQALENVLCDYVAKRSLTVPQAISAAKDILFRNADGLYQLGLSLDDAQSGPDVNGSNAGPAAQKPGDQSRDWGSLLSKFQFVYVQWLDWLGTMRCRCVPIAAFRRLHDSNGRLSISKGNLGTLQNDHFTPVCDPVGSIYVQPDLMSLKPMFGNQSATVMAQFVDSEGVGIDLCPRASLHHYVNAFEKDFGIHFLVGFEIEIVFCNRQDSKEEPFLPLDTLHAWGSFTDEQYLLSMDLMCTIATGLQAIGIEIEQWHSEAGPGQYEFVLPPRPPIEAVDTLVQARQCIQQIAASRGLRATCHPMPFPGIGTAAHAHISLNPLDSRSNMASVEMSFMASVLAHLPAICAFTMPQAVSYDRIVDDGWTSGTWVAWGVQNREVPLRQVESGRWEVRCLDGMANMYLALCVILAVGHAGVQKGMSMEMQACSVNPTRLSMEEKRAMGVTVRLPTSIGAAVEALSQDQEIDKILRPGLAKHYLAMKNSEQEMLNGMSAGDRRKWLIERY